MQGLVDKLPWQEIHQLCNEYNVDPNLVAAIIMKESSCNPYAIRFESKWRYFPSDTEMKVYSEKVGMSLDTVKMGMATSWGPMQIMGTVAYEKGFRGWFPELCSNTLGLEYGIKHLKWFASRYAKTSDVVSCYNAGSPKKDSVGQYINFRYVDDVMRVYRKLDGD